eukprot:CAMPEP_0170558030 /NCGR_PEP_ID=MMETSP0211-20121228/32225_1 /TAXON_ID=311385 /ORGANISM="Pseudokeronopsis sp., Strain OXSARD2" /LENGTH=197 /DNA_ID=CAMNT_0010869583 /DNA_START=303 /DNA_END=896 /DNA_ORIENTATION=+
MFKKVECMQSYDETEQLIEERLNKLTATLMSIFNELNQNKSPRALQKELIEFFASLEPKGFLVCLGFRKTIGSQEDFIPPDKNAIKECFNKPHKTYTAEELMRNPHNPSVLTMGARAMQKHAPRSQEGFWGHMEGLTEKQRNDLSNKILRRVLDHCVWLNVHKLKVNFEGAIIEVREKQGYGIRWTAEGELRGLVEP